MGMMFARFAEHTKGGIKRGACKRFRQAANNQPPTPEACFDITYGAIYEFVFSLEAQSMTHGLMTMKNALIQIAAEKGNDVVPQAGRRAKSDRTKGNGGGQSAFP
jgi:hypothetical protein